MIKQGNLSYSKNIKEIYDPILAGKIEWDDYVSYRPACFSQIDRIIVKKGIFYDFSVIQLKALCSHQLFRESKGFGYEYNLQVHGFPLDFIT